MRRLTNLALTRMYVCIYINIISLCLLQRISDSNGCDHFNQISFKLITLNHSVNSLKGNMMLMLNFLLMLNFFSHQQEAWQCFVMLSSFLLFFFSWKRCEKMKRYSKHIANAFVSSFPSGKDQSQEVEQQQMIPQRFERRTYSYQKYTLPVKLRNLYFVLNS